MDSQKQTDSGIEGSEDGSSLTPSQRQTLSSIVDEAIEAHDLGRVANFIAGCRAPGLVGPVMIGCLFQRAPSKLRYQASYLFSEFLPDISPKEYARLLVLEQAMFARFQDNEGLKRSAERAARAVELGLVPKNFPLPDYREGRCIEEAERLWRFGFGLLMLHFVDDEWRYRAGIFDFQFNSKINEPYPFVRLLEADITPAGEDKPRHYRFELIYRSRAWAVRSAGVVTADGSINPLPLDDDLVRIVARKIGEAR